MKTKEERLEAVHAAAMEYRRKRDKQIISVLSVFSFFILAGIIRIMTGLNGLHESLQNSGFTGSSLLDSSVGGYVLVGVLSFAAAVIITVACIRYKRR